MKGTQIGAERDAGLRGQRHARVDRDAAITGSNIEPVIGRGAGQAGGGGEPLDRLAHLAIRKIDHGEPPGATLEYEEPLIGIVQCQAIDCTGDGAQFDPAHRVEGIAGCRTKPRCQQQAAKGDASQRAPADHATTFCDCWPRPATERLTLSPGFR